MCGVILEAILTERYKKALVLRNSSMFHTWLLLYFRTIIHLRLLLSREKSWYSLEPTLALQCESESPSDSYSQEVHLGL